VPGIHAAIEGDRGGELFLAAAGQLGFDLVMDGVPMLLRNYGASALNPTCSHCHRFRRNEAPEHALRGT
jgi:hypothetical protein